MAKFMAKHYEARLRALKQEKSLAESSGEQKRFEITEYSGLIGKTLDLTAVIFPGYEPIKKRQLSTPENFNLPETNFSNPSASSGRADNLEKIYKDYVASHPEIFEILTEPEPTEDATNSPEIAPAPDDTASGTPDSAETPEGKTETSDSELPVEPEIPEVPGIVEPESVDIIELPLPEPTEEIKVPVETPAPAETPTPVEEEVVPAEPTPDETPVPAETPAE